MDGKGKGGAEGGNRREGEGKRKWYWWGKEQSGICREDVGGTYAGH